MNENNSIPQFFFLERLKSFQMYQKPYLWLLLLLVFLVGSCTNKKSAGEIHEKADIFCDAESMD
ncbi:MAG TPA: hypothetical protein DCG75_16175, partial [Bacteroidales bacterium]|nr:hypothetical protein [Bacteroidales bacterium]